MWAGKKIMHRVTVWSFSVVFTGVFPNVYFHPRVPTAECQCLLFTLREAVTALFVCGTSWASEVTQQLLLSAEAGNVVWIEVYQQVFLKTVQRRNAKGGECGVSYYLYSEID